HASRMTITTRTGMASKERTADRPRFLGISREPLASNSAIVNINGQNANYAADNIALSFYYCTSQSCLNYNKGNPLWVFDVRDTNLSPYTWTFADVSPPFLRDQQICFRCLYFLFGDGL
ncbi:MAG: hypothetical protein ACREAN_07930, partial [Nitrosopumilaceae archaeon]